MGLYPAECNLCKKPFMWFSGNPHQICNDCGSNHDFEATEGSAAAPITIVGRQVGMSTNSPVTQYEHENAKGVRAIMELIEQTGHDFIKVEWLKEELKKRNWL